MPPAPAFTHNGPCSQPVTKPDVRYSYVLTSAHALRISQDSMGLLTDHLAWAFHCRRRQFDPLCRASNPSSRTPHDPPTGPVDHQCLPPCPCRPTLRHRNTRRQDWAPAHVRNRPDNLRSGISSSRLCPQRWNPHRCPRFSRCRRSSPHAFNPGTHPPNLLRTPRAQHRNWNLGIRCNSRLSSWPTIGWIPAHSHLVGSGLPHQYPNRYHRPRRDLSHCSR